jgi:hypothetical protein
MFNSSRDLKQAAADARELLREQTRLEKRMLRDLRFCAERSTMLESDWEDFLRLHQQYGKEGPRELWETLVPYWSQCQCLNGGIPCPERLQPEWLELSAEKPRTKPTTRKPPGAPRKPRVDAGKPRASYKPRKPA